MIRFEYIMILVWLRGSGCFDTREEWYDVTTNITVDGSTCAESRFVTNVISRTTCVHSCTRMEQVITEPTQNLEQKLTVSRTRLNLNLRLTILGDLKSLTLFQPPERK